MIAIILHFEFTSLLKTTINKPCNKKGKHSFSSLVFGFFKRFLLSSPAHSNQVKLDDWIKLISNMSNAATAETNDFLCGVVEGQTILSD